MPLSEQAQNALWLTFFGPQTMQSMKSSRLEEEAQKKVGELQAYGKNMPTIKQLQSVGAMPPVPGTDVNPRTNPQMQPPAPDVSQLAPGTAMGQTEAGKAGYEEYEKQQAAGAEEEKSAQVETLIDQLKMKYNLDDNFTADLMQGLSRIGEGERALGLAEKLPGQMADVELKKKEKEEKVAKAARDAKYDAAKFEMDVRKEIKGDPVVKSFVVINRNWRGINTVWSDYVAKTPEQRDKQSKIAIDQALVNLFNKLTDPNSVVRESEFARTAEGQALMERVKGWLPKLRQGGVGLTDKERQEVVNSAGLLYKVAANEFETVKAGYGEAMKSYEGLGISVDNIFAPILSAGSTETPTIKGGTMEAPAIGTVEQGYRFLGGDPTNQQNWEKVE